jgi:hypothetical protein
LQPAPGRSRGFDAIMKHIKPFGLAIFFLGVISYSLAVESGMCRLLSVSESEKLILISQIPNKTKFLLDAASAKITVNGKPAEFRDLVVFSTIQVKMELRKINRKGIDLDGVATEIQISIPGEADK